MIHVLFCLAFWTSLLYNAARRCLSVWPWRSRYIFKEVGDLFFLSTMSTSGPYLRLSSSPFPPRRAPASPSRCLTQLVPLPTLSAIATPKIFCRSELIIVPLLHLCSCSPSQDVYVTTAHPMRSHETRGAHGPPPGSGTQLARICYLRPIW